MLEIRHLEREMTFHNIEIFYKFEYFINKDGAEMLKPVTKVSVMKDFEGDIHLNMNSESAKAFPLFIDARYHKYFFKVRNKGFKIHGRVVVKITPMNEISTLIFRFYNPELITELGGIS